ncbi:Twitching mobility protein [wastewater metagenome]|uniref:Twitching mobility protein n=3 Tax=root TaxID=1 RepID=A0A5B8RJY6_9ZZZZ|nr:PilT/PilU family type 4a pilus ATPase [Arhodomonas aquaeolei]MCS4504352.1 PilT/PilU family type 4a pilus ATPase [Arhodomonas aquaeolei]QEA07435.1 twitching mobility protein [uncultured organism]
MELDRYLQLMPKHNASDLFFSAGAPVGIRIDGRIRAIEPDRKLAADEIERLAHWVMTEPQREEFEREYEINLAYSPRGLGRFRVNIYRQRGSVSMVIRFITHEIPDLEALNLPTRLRELVLEPRGLVLVVGATGSGKSTTLASLIDYRNTQHSGHILTVENPIEYLYQHKRCIIDQREIGLDTHSYERALANAMRGSPDVILIGEIRERETMAHALAYAETGHLCLSTLHANNANQTLDRILNFFPETAHHQLRNDLSQHLCAIVSQRLIPAREGGRVPAVEILLNTPYVSDLLERGEIDELKEAMKQGLEDGMQTFDESLYRLYEAGQITRESALEHADSRNDLGLRIRLGDGGGDLGE